MIANNNLLGMNARRNIGRVANSKAKASAKLSSGKRINKSADDSAGVAISETLKAQIRGLNQANRNIEDGKSLITTMDGGMSEITEMLQRQRELTLQAMNDGVLTDSDKEKIQLEINQLTDGITEMAENTEFNGINLLNIPEGTSTISTVQKVTIGPYESLEYGFIDVKEGESFTVKVDEFSPILPGSWPDMNIVAPNGDTFGFGSTYLNGGSNCTDTSSSAYTSGEYSGWDDDNEYFSFNNVTAEGEGKWIVIINNQTSGSSNFKLSSSSDITPYGAEKTIVNELYIQAGANSDNGLYIQRYDCTAQSLGSDPILINPYEEAEKSLNKLDKALEKMASNRANAGSQYNRLNYISNSVQTSSINLADANSRIEDADMAREMMEITKNNTLEQAGLEILLYSTKMIPSTIKKLLEV